MSAHQVPCGEEFHITLSMEDVTKNRTEDSCLTAQMQETAPKTFLLPNRTSPFLHPLCQTTTAYDIPPENLYLQYHSP